MTAYKLLGKCYQELKFYDQSIQAYIKCLQFAWFLEDGVQELKCYDLMGMQYYYMGDLARAQYYH